MASYFNFPNGCFVCPLDGIVKQEIGGGQGTDELTSFWRIVYSDNTYTNSKYTFFSQRGYRETNVCSYGPIDVPIGKTLKRISLCLTINTDDNIKMGWVNPSFLFVSKSGISPLNSNLSLTNKPRTPGLG